MRLFGEHLAGLAPERSVPRAAERLVPGQAARRPRERPLAVGRGARSGHELVSRSVADAGLRLQRDPAGRQQDAVDIAQQPLVVRGHGIAAGRELAHSRPWRATPRGSTGARCGRCPGPGRCGPSTRCGAPRPSAGSRRWRRRGCGRSLERVRREFGAERFQVGAELELVVRDPARAEDRRWRWSSVTRGPVFAL